MTDMEQAKAMFSRMPDAVFGIWLAPLVEKGGWPFTSLRQSTVNTEWHRVLDGMTLQSITNRTWTRQDLDRSTDGFHPSAVQTILGICAAHVSGWPPRIPGLPPSQVASLIPALRDLKSGRAAESFLRSRRYLEEHGRLHTPAVLLQEPDGLKIMDGNHRLAAMFSLPTSPDLRLDAWIGN